MITPAASATTVVHASNQDPRWLAYIATANPTLFQHPDWASLIEESYGLAARVALVMRGDDVVGGLPYSEVNDFRGQHRVALAFADICEPLGKAEWMTIEQALCDDGVPWQIRSRVAPGPLAASSRQIAVHQVVELPPVTQTAQRFCERKQTKEVRHGLRAGVTARHVHDDAAIDVFYRFHARTRMFKHHLLPQPRSFFQALARRYFPDRGFVLVAELDGTPLAAELLLICGDTLYYKFSASDETALFYRPNDFLLWKAIETAADMGLRRVDLGISEAESLARFKRKYGPAEQPVFMARYAQNEKRAPVVQFEESLAQITSVLTARTVPLATADATSDVLYRFFA